MEGGSEGAETVRRGIVVCRHKEVLDVTYVLYWVPLTLPTRSQSRPRAPPRKGRTPFSAPRARARHDTQHPLLDALHDGLAPPWSHAPIGTSPSPCAGALPGIAPHLWQCVVVPAPLRREQDALRDKRHGLRVPDARGWEGEAGCTASRAQHTSSERV